MKCVHVLGSIADPSAGPSYSVTRLSEELELRGMPSTIRSVRGWRGANEAEAPQHFIHKQSFARIPIMKRMCFSRELRLALFTDPAAEIIFHTHGFWLMPNVYAALAARARRMSLVISPRGMLGPEALRISRSRKRLFWLVYQRSAANFAALIHATSVQELDEVRAFGLSSPVAVIPNGIDIPPRVETTKAFPSVRTILSLGRIHPKKGLDLLLLAWAQIESANPNWRLRIVGPDEQGHAVDLRNLIEVHRLSRVSIEGPLHGSGRLAAYTAADLFVLPSRNENFGLTAAEALAAGIPVLASKRTPWSALIEKGCGWWAEPNPAAIAKELQQAMNMPGTELQLMGRRGRDWMRRDFSWPAVAAQMISAYSWVNGKGDRPEFVR
jgi:glycosyltransferase involved in cell wall biosynthesis